MSLVCVGDKKISYTYEGYGSDVVVFVHGIMGNKKNLSGFVKQFLNKFPTYSAITFDLPNHGESDKQWSPFSVDNCASSIAQACKELNLLPKAAFGHSFGGKVVVLLGKYLESLEKICLLDSVVGLRDKNKAASFAGDQSVEKVLEILGTISWPKSTRKEVMNDLISNGISHNVSAFMTTNLVEDERGLTLRFEPDNILQMLEDYNQLDCWPIIEKMSAQKNFYLVRAEHGGRLYEEDQQRFEVITGNNCYVLKNSGHFVHIDNPKGLLVIMGDILA